MKPVAQEVEVVVLMTSVLLSLTSSLLKLHLLTQTEEKWTLQQPNLASHSLHCSCSASSLYCRNNGDNPRSGQRDCVLATKTANFLLFLHFWTKDRATNTYRFLWKESSTATYFPFCFPKEYKVPEWTASSFFQKCLKTTSLRVLSQTFITGDFLSFIFFYAADVKGS